MRHRLQSGAQLASQVQQTLLVAAQDRIKHFQSLQLLRLPRLQGWDFRVHVADSGEPELALAYVGFKLADGLVNDFLVCPMESLVLYLHAAYTICYSE